MKTIASVLILTALILTGCQSDGDTTRAQGAGFGALLGAGIGAVIGNQTGDAESGALIGAALGGLAGFAYGDHVAGKKKEYASQEDYLNACIAEAKVQYKRVKGYNDTVRFEIAAIDKELQSIEGSASLTAADQDRLTKLRSTLSDRLVKAEEHMAAVSDEIAIQREVLKKERKNSDPAEIQALENQIALLEEQKAELETSTQQLAALNNRASA